MDSESNKPGLGSGFTTQWLWDSAGSASRKGAGTKEWKRETFVVETATSPLPTKLFSPSLATLGLHFPDSLELRCGHMTVYSEGTKIGRRCALSRPDTERTPRHIFPFLFPFSANWSLHIHRGPRGHILNTDMSSSLRVSEILCQRELPQQP